MGQLNSNYVAIRRPKIPQGMPKRPKVKASRADFSAIVEYALASAAHLISPPKVDGEDNEFRCDDVAAAVRGLHRTLCDDQD